MATTAVLIDQYVQGEDVPGAYPRTSLLSQLRWAVVSCAIDIAGEAPSTDYHAERGAYAAQVIREPAPAALRFLPLVLVANSNAGWNLVKNGDTPPDSSVKNLVSALWNAAVGVVTTE